MKQKEPVDKNSREFLERRFSAGRSSLLLILVLSVINFIFILLDRETYFLFSTSVPYYLTLFVKGVENNFTMGAWDNGPATMVCVALSALVLLAYLLCWRFSKKRSGWLTVATVLFILDTVGLVLISFGMLNEPMSTLMDFILHVCVVVQLVLSCNAGRKLNQMSQEQPLESRADLSKTNPEVFS